MKKILLLISLLLLCGCSAKREEYFILSFDGNETAVGYDRVEDIEYIEGIDSYDFYLNRDEEAIVKRIVIYPDDLNDRQIILDGRPLPEKISEACKDFKGSYSDEMGHSCVISKDVKGTKTYAIFYGDILADDSDVLDRIEVW